MDTPTPPVSLPDRIQSAITGCGGRRFLMTVGAGVVDSLLLIGHFIDQGTYATLTLATVGVYIGASTMQQMQGNRRDPA